MGLAALMVGGTMAGLLFAVMGLVLRLMLGPMSLGPFVSTIEDYLNASVSGLVVHFDQAMLEWSQSEGRVDLTILGAKVFDRGGRIIAQAPKAELDFDASALLAGRADLKRFALIGMQLTAVRTNERALKLGFRTSEGESDVLKAISDALRYQGGKTLTSWGRARSKLDRFAILNARIAFHDERTGLFLISPNANLTIRSKGQLLNASMTAAIDISGERASLVAEAELTDQGVPRHGEMEIHGLSLKALAANSPTFSGFAPFGLALDFSGEVFFQPNGKVQFVDFGVAGKGTAGRPKLDPVSIDIEKLGILGRYDGLTDRLLLDEVLVRGDALTASGSGFLKATWQESALLSLTGQLDMVDVAVNLPDRFAAPVLFERISLSGTYDREGGKLTIDNAALGAGRLQAKLAGAVTLAGEQWPALDFEGSVDPIAVRDLLHYWPAGLAEGARSWIDDNISAGRLGEAVLTTRIPAGALGKEALPEESLSFAFPFTDVTAQYIKGLTRITNAYGSGHLSGNTFRAEVTRGNVGPLMLRRGDAVIPNLHVVGAPGTVSAHVDGKVEDVLLLVDQQPLGYPTRFHIDPKQTRGEAALDLKFTIPMLKALSVEQMGISIRAKTTGLSMPMGMDRVIEDGSLNFAIDSHSLVAQGPVRVSGVPLEMKWEETFAPLAITTRVDVKGTMDNEGRNRLGLPDAGLVTGPSQVSLLLTGHRARFTAATLTADLRAAEISVPTINLEKPAGQPATLSGILHFADDGAISVEKFAVASKAIDIRGGFSIDADGGLASANMPVIKVGTGDDFSAVAKPMTGGGLNVSIQGRSYDASRLFASKPKPQSKPTKAALQVLAQEEAALKDPLVFDARLDRVLLNGGVVMSNFTMNSAFGANAHLETFALGASLPDKGTLGSAFTAKPDGAREITVDVSDAGVMVHGLTAFGSMRKGTATLSVMLARPTEVTSTSPTPDYHGTLVLRDFSLVDQPFFMRLFSAGSLLGPIALLQGSGIQFAKLNAPFHARGKVITITEGRGSGPAVGISFQGVIDRRNNTIDLAGTMVPIYGLNSMLGAVPIIGNILVSKQGEGIFGLTYSVRGEIDHPSLSVNPLSVLTPGIFRRIFERPMPTAALSPSESPTANDAVTDAQGGDPNAAASVSAQVPVPKPKPETATP